ncbi:hypothetical protein AG1IA_07996 [Rhizoctonia solani AG-1 IA]|uniref:Uncharacterized protein n=1 Tax=Thanatephorus cucumeris (strain AG1-IA) TaxID=983506 RepID=L8WMG9_THACA|nr:hypothetical protein AG1IA_07996 [Rhizoctonia solani AG-1 IA]
MTTSEWDDAREFTWEVMGQWAEWRCDWQNSEYTSSRRVPVKSHTAEALIRLVSQALFETLTFSMHHSFFADWPKTCLLNS